MSEKPKTVRDARPAEATADIVRSEAYETQNVVSGTAPESNPAFGPPLKADEIGTLGPYRVLRELGRGGMGAVYLGFDERLKRKVALKVMLPKYAAIASSKNRFLREARAAAGITHDHIVTIYEADEHGGTPYMAMQLLQGYPLDEYLKRQGKLQLAELLRIGREIALGLSAAHAVGLVHRDIKPGNIWLEAPNGRVKILDFGLAKPTDEQKIDHELTATGAILGTPAYMPPEQARGAKADFRADLFSLGVVLYRLATGAMPFTGDTMMAILAAVIADDPTPVRELHPEIPEPLAKLIHDLLEKKPENRPKSAEVVAERLQQIQLGTNAAIALPMQIIPLGSLPTVTAIPTGADPFANIDATESDEIVSRTIATVPAAKKAGPIPKWPFLALGLLLVVVAALLPQIVSIMTPKGTLVIESVDPDVEITVKKSGAVIVDKSKQREFTLKVADDYSIEMTEKEGLKLSTNKFEIVRNGKAVVKVTVQRPVAARPKVEPPVTPGAPILEFAADWPGDRSPRPASETVADWAEKGAVAHVSGRGTIAFPPVEAKEFALDIEVEIRGEHELAITLGDGPDFRPELRLWQKGGVGFAHVVRVQDRKWFARATPAKIDRFGTVSLVVSPAGTGLFRDGKYLRGSPATAAATVRLAGRGNDTDATVRTLRLRPVTKAELAEVAAKLGASNQPDDAGEDLPDPDRAAAEWVLGLKGEVHILSGGSVKVVRTIAELPKVPFATLRIELPPGAKATNADVAKNIPDKKLLVAILSGIPLGDATSIHLAGIPTLTDVHLADTNVTDVGAIKIAQLPKLQLLNLANTAVTDGVAGAFGKHPSLIDINLHGTPVGDATAAALGRCPKLAKLLLSGTKVTDLGLATLESSSNLRELTLAKAPVTEAGVKKLAAALPLCKIEWDGGTIGPRVSANAGLAFDGRSTSVSIPTLKAGNNLPITIEAWITPSTVTGMARHLFLFGEPGGGMGLSDKGNLGIGFRTPNEWVSDYGRSSLQPGERVHVAAVATAERFELFLNGKSDGVKKVAIGALVTPAPPALIGKHPKDAPEGYFHGTLHAMRVSKSARYASAFAPTSRWKPDADTIVQFHFDEGSGTALTDRSGHGHNGTILNGNWVK